MGYRAHTVSYPLRGGQVLNLAGVEERREWTSESWDTPGDKAEFLARFAGFRGPVAQAVTEADNLRCWALYTRPVAQSWVKDNVVLLGDAAHPTLPFMAQGACLALEDAW
ncbi:MAG: FAD-dependent monooxygenase, partial [Cyanobacteria bacterium P01_F01_bin.153]